jgi:hypothetical protein
VQEDRLIENISWESKATQKPVVVLRHEPSILPILVWSKGKNRHLDVIEGLPRKNKFRCLRLFDFSYYYFILFWTICSFISDILRGRVVICQSLLF